MLSTILVFIACFLKTYFHNLVLNKLLGVRKSVDLLTFDIPVHFIRKFWLGLFIYLFNAGFAAGQLTGVWH